jgi:preprotein translocase subunit SecD
VARSPGLAVPNQPGLSRTTTGAPNRNSIGMSIMLVLVLVLGCIYAAPNLFQPDPALQLRGVSEAYPIDQATMDKAIAALGSANIAVTGSESDGKNGLIRVTSDDDQLHGRDVVAAALNVGDEHGYVIALNRASNTPEWLQSLGAKPMNLGLDLSGGVHFLLEVDMDKFIGDRLNANEEAIRDLLVKERIRYAGRDWQQGRELRIPFDTPESRDRAQTAITAEIDGFDMAARDIDGRPGLVMAISDTKLKELEEFAISQNLTSLRNRVNELGVAEPLVQRLGSTRIVLDLPGIQDSARAKEIINKFANLDFRLVAGGSARPAQTETYDYEGRPITLDRASIVTGDQVVNAVQDFDPESNQPQVSIELDNAGGRRMNSVTQNNVGNSMAILFKELKVRERTVMKDGVATKVPFTVEDRRLINVATIQSALGFRFRITGLELQEARDLALLLRAGALAAPMYIVEERTVGASLGDENIRQGARAMLMGFAFVAVFMLFYYRLLGISAVIALGANVVLLAAIMSVLGATLTLPGIAGILLTVGMAVDANVLIYERMRDESVRLAPQAAIASGFDRAFGTILDANVTTLFVGLILFSLGSGPVKGFAVTLCVGILTSMFTGILVTRAVVNLMFGYRKLEALHI